MLKNGKVFSRLIEDYGTEDAGLNVKSVVTVAETQAEEGNADKEVIAALMQAEERKTGAVTWSVYTQYLRYAGGLYWAPVIVLFLALTQGAQGKRLEFRSVFVQLSYSQLLLQYSWDYGHL